MAFLSSGFFNDLLNSLTTNVTGSVFLTLLFLTFIILAFALVFRIPIEFTVLFVFPLLLGFAAYTSAYMAVAGVGILYLAVLIAKNFFFWR